MNNLLKDVSFYPIFLLIMIISSNFLAEIFPCRFQSLLSSNNYIKHVFGYLTLVFFVSLNIEDLNTSVQELFKNSLFLYLGFMMLMKTNKYIFLLILVLLCLLYINYLNKTLKKNNTDDKDGDKDNVNVTNKWFTLIEKNDATIKNVIVGLLVFGFVVYLGEKKYEYKGDFSLMTFLLGKPTCKNASPDVSVITALEYALK